MGKSVSCGPFKLRDGRMVDAIVIIDRKLHVRVKTGGEKGASLFVTPATINAVATPEQRDAIAAIGLTLRTA